ncbi:MAG: TetR/AcrR family transcriptional regulator [Burkholderiales bacterium]|jgi:AcrR family transcriptional regulator|nr:TetR/AcrR family transcriptional regulator [Burkholderiales bacterium]OJX34287.1 MAG: TetR family transcriptional regulator [Burkholderiales bacterium 68-12]
MCTTRSRPTSAAAKRPRGRPPKTPDQRDEGNRRQDIIQAAANLFRRHGFNGTSTRRIASAVGMHSGSIFCHFKSKDALLYEVLQIGMRSALARQRMVLLEKRDAETTLRRLIRSHLESLLESNSGLLWEVPYDSRALNARQRHLIEELKCHYEAAWMPVLHELASTGCLRADLTLARHFIFGALNWSVDWFDAKEGASLDDLADAMVALVIHKTSR